MSDLPPEGWYPDPQLPDHLRYWNGAEWGEHRAPRQRPASEGQAEPPHPAEQPSKQRSPKKERPDKVALRAARDAANVEARATKQAAAAEVARLAAEQYEADLEKEFTAAAQAATESRAAEEEYALQRALQLAKRVRGKSGVKEVEDRIRTGRLDGTLLPTFSLLGVVKGEGLLSYWARSQEMLSHQGGKPIYIYSDRILQGSMVWPFDASVQAQFYLDGQKQVTTRASLTSALLLSPLPGSALIPALARPKKETHDKRIAEFHIAGDGWSTFVRTHPDFSGDNRSLAEQVNRHAESLAEQNAPPLVETLAVTAAATPPSEPSAGLIGQFERIAELQRQGAITEDEATALKGKLLGG